MAYHIPEEETLDRPALERLQRRKLSRLLETVRASNDFYGRKLTGIAFDPLRDPLDVLPCTTRSEVQKDLLDHPPYGTNHTYPIERYRRLHVTSGSTGRPLYWLDTAEAWGWWRRCWGIVFRAAGVTAADRLAFPFSFGPFIGFWGAFESAAALDLFCLPCGGMNTAGRLSYMLEHGATVLCCTPTYALRMAEVAAEKSFDLSSSSVRALIVAGEPGGHIPATRARIEREWGARVFDHAGMTEIGPWGFECEEAPQGMHVIESEFIAEVRDPASGEPVEDGTAGELILTNLGRDGSPLLRYHTGDVVSLTRGKCRCGRCFALADGGVRGRIDDMLFIRGNNVYPAAVEGVVRAFTEVVEFRMEVDESGPMTTLRIDVETAEGEKSRGLSERIAEAVKERLYFTPTVAVVPFGTLPRFEMKARRFVRRAPDAPPAQQLRRASRERKP